MRLSGHEVLRDVSFEIRPGQLIGLIGSNGAGKTTLFRVILGLQQAHAGQVLLDGRARSRRNPLIGYVPQKFLLDPDMPLRARDLVGLGVDAHRFGVPLPSRGRRALVEEMLTAVDAGRFADARVGLLSGGEQQRVLIAHALAARPKLLLLDEPLANLDLRAAHEVVALLARIARERGRRADQRPRDEPAAARHGPRRVPRRRARGQRHHRAGRARGRAQRALRQPRRRAQRARPRAGGGRRRRSIRSAGHEAAPGTPGRRSSRERARAGSCSRRR